MRKSYLIVIVVASIFVLAIPMMVDSHMAMAKKHVGPVPFPPDIIPTIANKHIDKSHNDISLKK